MVNFMFEGVVGVFGFCDVSVFDECNVFACELLRWTSKTGVASEQGWREVTSRSFIGSRGVIAQWSQ